MDINKKAADNIRRLVVSMVQNANSGHPGGAMGAADFIHILYSEFLQFNPGNPHWDLRDRFFMDPGHMSAMLYSVLSLCDKYTMDDLKKFRQWGSPTPGHPELDVARGVENTSGPLGQGHVFAVGAAIAEKFLEARFGSWLHHKIFTLISDGGIQEEISQSAGRIAGHLGLGNLIMFYDSNDVQLSTKVADVSSEDVEAKYQAWGWQVIGIDGHNFNEIRKALRDAISHNTAPTLIIGKTIMAKGAVDKDGKSLEGAVSTHGAPLGSEATSKTIINLGGDPENPFSIDLEVKAYYEERMKVLSKVVKEKEEEREHFKKKNTALAQKYFNFFSGKMPNLDFSKVVLKDNMATRAASSSVLSFLADNLENMLVCSADLSNSDKTDGFLKKTKPLKRGDFSGAFLQIGVSELTMSAIMNGIALHGGVIPVGGTFFVFSDYMKPAIRIAGLMGLPSIYVLTHDSFRVGEDGPTHQPVEHEAQLRLLEHIENEKGNPACLVLRPADSAETVISWKLALENKNSPTVLILSRQAIVDLPDEHNKSLDAAENIRKGAYAVTETPGSLDLILLASGSEVSLCVELASRLQKNHNLNTRVVSVPSEGLFRRQSQEYQLALLPTNVAIYGISAGVAKALDSLVGPWGEVHSLKRFGASAPYKVLDEKFGFTAEKLEKEILNMLKRWKNRQESFIKSLQ